MYAPTWRDNEYHFIGRYKFSLKMDLDQMQKELGVNTLCFSVCIILYQTRWT
nr:CDP-glycerol glycerophosphotransferase family protein [Sinobaca sp. H24]